MNPAKRPCVDCAIVMHGCDVVGINLDDLVVYEDDTLRNTNDAWHVQYPWPKMVGWDKYEAFEEWVADHHGY